MHLVLSQFVRGAVELLHTLGLTKNGQQFKKMVVVFFVFAKRSPIGSFGVGFYDFGAFEGAFGGLIVLLKCFVFDIARHAAVAQQGFDFLFHKTMIQIVCKSVRI